MVRPWKPRALVLKVYNNDRDRNYSPAEIVFLQSRNPDLYHNPEDIGDYTKVREDIYIEDQVHFNKKGYEIYKNFWLKQLDDLL